MGLISVGPSNSPIVEVISVAEAGAAQVRQSNAASERQVWLRLFLERFIDIEGLEYGLIWGSADTAERGGRGG